MHHVLGQVPRLKEATPRRLPLAGSSQDPKCDQQFCFPHKPSHAPKRKLCAFYTNAVTPLFNIVAVPNSSCWKFLELLLSSGSTPLCFSRTSAEDTESLFQHFGKTVSLSHSEGTTQRLQTRPVSVPPWSRRKRRRRERHRGEVLHRTAGLRKDSVGSNGLLHSEWTL